MQRPRRQSLRRRARSPRGQRRPRSPRPPHPRMPFSSPSSPKSRTLTLSFSLLTASPPWPLRSERFARATPPTPSPSPSPSSKSTGVWILSCRAYHLSSKTRRTLDSTASALRIPPSSARSAASTARRTSWRAVDLSSLRVEPSSPSRGCRLRRMPLRRIRLLPRPAPKLGPSPTSSSQTSTRRPLRSCIARELTFLPLWTLCPPSWSPTLTGASMRLIALRGTSRMREGLVSPRSARRRARRKSRRKAARWKSPSSLQRWSSSSRVAPEFSALNLSC
mmetsp:Transcript_14808/g.27434  ORF Transcript_14808/g.27434 Transcript_14808/m.27434 type:complete len:278 (+) Transcript_14808:2760-3593(+)